MFPRQIEQQQQQQGRGAVKRESSRKRKRVRGVDRDDQSPTSGGDTRGIALDTQLRRIVFSVSVGSKSGELLSGKWYDVSVEAPALLEGEGEVEKDVGEDRIVLGEDGMELGGMSTLEVRMWRFC